MDEFLWFGLGKCDRHSSRIHLEPSRGYILCSGHSYSHANHSHDSGPWDLQSNVHGHRQWPSHGGIKFFECGPYQNSKHGPHDSGAAATTATTAGWMHNPFLLGPVMMAVREYLETFNEDIG